MHERAKLIGEKLTIWSAPDSGIGVELNIPAARVYIMLSSPRRSWLGARLFAKSAPIES